MSVSLDLFHLVIFLEQLSSVLHIAQSQYFGRTMEVGSRECLATDSLRFNHASPLLHTCLIFSQVSTTTTLSCPLPQHFLIASVYSLPNIFITSKWKPQTLALYLFPFLFGHGSCYSYSIRMDLPVLDISCKRNHVVYHPLFPDFSVT